MNKFEQVASNDRQMSLAGWWVSVSGGGYVQGVGLGWVSQGVMSRGGRVYPEGVPYHVTYSMMHAMLPKYLSALFRN